jgi:plastocyanin
VRFTKFLAPIITFAALAAFTMTTASAQQTTTIAVGDIWFCDSSFQFAVCETTVNAGDTVVWDFSPANIPHSTTECGASCDSPTSSPRWDSGIISDGSSFSFTFDEPGTYRYFCQVHPAQQRGIITVVAAAEPTDTAAPVDGTPGTAPTSSSGNATPAGGTIVVPVTGAGPDTPASDGSWPITIVVASGGALLASAGLMLRQRAGR